MDNNKPLVYICSPLRGDYAKNTLNAKKYCKEAVAEGVLPIAPHLYCPMFLDDRKATERATGIALGLRLLEMCAEIWVYGYENPSEGMKAEIEHAKALNIPIREVKP